MQPSVYCHGLCNMQALPAMVEAGRGTILFTGATAGMRGGPKFALLACPKFALRALSQSIAREFQPQVSLFLLTCLCWKALAPPSCMENELAGALETAHPKLPLLDQSPSKRNAQSTCSVMLLRCCPVKEHSAAMERYTEGHKISCRASMWPTSSLMGSLRRLAQRA